MAGLQSQFSQDGRAADVDALSTIIPQPPRDHAGTPFNGCGYLEQRALRVNGQQHRLSAASSAGRRYAGLLVDTGKLDLAAIVESQWRNTTARGERRALVTRTRAPQLRPPA